MPGTSGRRSLNQANGSSRNRTWDMVVKQPPALPTELRIHMGASSPGLEPEPDRIGRQAVAPNDRLEGSRRLYAFGFMVHYNILKSNSVNKSNKLYAANINLSNSHPYTIRCSLPAHLSQLPAPKSIPRIFYTG